MQKDFHYYATYCAAWLAGYSHEESMQICYSAQLVDWCSATFLSKLKGPRAAATTQLHMALTRLYRLTARRSWSDFTTRSACSRARDISIFAT